jgi:hypothetical protein
MDDNFGVKRFRTGLISNIRVAIHILDENNVHTDVIDRIKENLNNYVDNLYFDEKVVVERMEMLEIQVLAESIIQKPYQEWMFKEKTKIKYNFAEDAKRTWNRIKQSAGQATKIKQEFLQITTHKIGKFDQRR